MDALQQAYVSGCKITSGDECHRIAPPIAVAAARRVKRIADSLLQQICASLNIGLAIRVHQMLNVVKIRHMLWLTTIGVLQSMEKNVVDQEELDVIESMLDSIGHLDMELQKPDNRKVIRFVVEKYRLQEALTARLCKAYMEDLPWWLLTTRTPANR